LFVFLAVTSSAIAGGPPRGPSTQLEGGIQFCEISLTGAAPGQTMKLWLYLPPGTHSKGSLACVFIAPGGTNLITGNILGDGDRPEHLPYVKAGFAVVGYELDGAYVKRDRDGMFPRIKQFIDAEGGVANARAAIDYVLAQVPEVDVNRLYAAGHSSAGTVALDVIAMEPRIKGGCAYAPCPNIRQRLTTERVKIYDTGVPGVADFVDHYSPTAFVQSLASTPLLLFSAKDDINIRYPLVRDFADQIVRAGAKSCKLVTAERGGHYQSMIEQGVPAGVAFLKNIGDQPQH